MPKIIHKKTEFNLEPILLNEKDEKLLAPHLVSAGTMFKWLQSDPPEYLLWKAFWLERRRPNPRCLILQRTLGHALRKFRIRHLAECGCPSSPKSYL